MYPETTTPYNVRVKSTSVVLEANGEPVIELFCEPCMREFTQSLLVQFGHPPGIAFMRKRTPPSGNWHDDVRWTQDFLDAHTMATGTDHQKFAVLAKENPAMLTLYRVMKLEVRLD